MKRNILLMCIFLIVMSSSVIAVDVNVKKSELKEGIKNLWLEEVG